MSSCSRLSSIAKHRHTLIFFINLSVKHIPEPCFEKIILRWTVGWNLNAINTISIHCYASSHMSRISTTLIYIHFPNHTNFACLSLDNIRPRKSDNALDISCIRKRKSVKLFDRLLLLSSQPATLIMY